MRIWRPTANGFIVRGTDRDSVADLYVYLTDNDKASDVTAFIDQLNTEL